jgi:hypothetical protein
MSVDRYEKRFPQIPNYNFDASDLGHIYSLSQCTIIAALDERFPLGAVNSFVVFVTDPSLSELDILYDWTLNRCDSNWNDINSNFEGYPKTLSTEYGRMRWKPVESGNYRLEISVYTEDNIVSETAEIQCTVFSETNDAKLEEFESLKTGIGEKVYFTGVKSVARRIIFEFGMDVDSYFESGSVLSNGTIPRRYLASLAYTAQIAWPENKKHPAYEPLRGNNISEWKDGVMRELSVPIYPGKAIQANRRMGLCRIMPMYAAMVLGLIDIPNVVGSGQKYRERMRRKLKEAFDRELSDDTKIALYNIIRFPKPNIMLAATILIKYLESWPQNAGFPTSPPDISKEIGHRQFLAMLYKVGGEVCAPRQVKKKKTRYIVWEGFAKNVAANYWLPAFDLFLLSDNSKLTSYRIEWDEWSDNHYQPSQGEQGGRLRSKPLASHFKNGFAQYVFLRRRYHDKLSEKYPNEYGPHSTHSIDNPMMWLAEYICDLPLDFSRPIISAHKDLKAPLEEANKKITAALGADYKVNSTCCFIPRMIGGTKYSDWSLSYHALGRGIDIDASTNPQLFSKPLEGIKGLLNDRYEHEIDWPTATLEEMKDADYVWRELAMEIFTEGEEMVLNGDIDSPYKYCNSLVPNFKKIVWDQEAEEGRFLEMQEVVIIAMTDEGFEWGGYWKNQKDFMHFQIK